MARMSTFLTSLAMALPLLAPAAAQQAEGRYYVPGTSPGQTVTVDCQSRNDRYQECRLPAGTQAVQLQQQMSRDPCIEGRTWGRRADALWVTNGCRASFIATTYAGGYPGQPGYPAGGSGAYAGQITCSSLGNRQQYCAANTGNRVDVLRVLGGQCTPGRDWSYDERGIRVGNNCRAQFGYGFANAGYPQPQPQPPVYPGNPGQGGGFAGQLTCTARPFGGGDQYCRANTQNRVQVLRQFAGQCRPGTDWSYDAGGIRVRNGCSAEFGFGQFGDHGGNTGGVNTGALIGGGILAAGLIALLASRGKKAEATGVNAAQIIADYGQFPGAAVEDARACLTEAARQVGATGGTRVALDRVDGASREGSGWRLFARLTGTYDGRAQQLSMTCLSSGGRVTNFDVR